MKREMGLIWDILDRAETLDHGGFIPYGESSHGFPRYTIAQVEYHVQLCRSMGWFIDMKKPKVINSLTWAGHDKLDDFRRNIQYTGDPLAELPK